MTKFSNKKENHEIILVIPAVEIQEKKFYNNSKNRF